MSLSIRMINLRYGRLQIYIYMYRPCCISVIWGMQGGKCLSDIFLPENIVLRLNWGRANNKHFLNDYMLVGKEKKTPALKRHITIFITWILHKLNFLLPMFGSFDALSTSPTALWTVVMFHATYTNGLITIYSIMVAMHTETW